MAYVTCPKCNSLAKRGHFPLWTILVAIFFFPLGLLALLVGRKPARCQSCGFMWEA